MLQNPGVEGVQAEASADGGLDEVPEPEQREVVAFVQSLKEQIVRITSLPRPWGIVAGPAPQEILSAALDYEGAKVVMDHARAIIRAHPELERAVELRAETILVPSTGSRWTVTSREHTASRGRHPTLVLYDEVGWARDDELFASLLAGQASVADPLLFVISTVGRRKTGPLWTVKTLAEGGDDPVLWWHSSENQSPRVTQDFLARQRRILLPGQFTSLPAARSHRYSGVRWTPRVNCFPPAPPTTSLRFLGRSRESRFSGIRISRQTRIRCCERRSSWMSIETRS